MAFLKKINIPMSTSLPLPNTNNKTAEAGKINELVNKTNRSNVGQNAWTSTTSGITYNTTDYPDNPLIFNKGETGLYNLLVELYGKEDGFLIMAEDYNNIANDITAIGAKADNATTSANTANTNANTANTNANTGLSEINKIKDGSTKTYTTWNNIDGKPATYPSTWATVSGKPSTFPPSSHTHDDRYYTESESNARYKLKGDFAIVTGSASFGSGTRPEANVSYPSGFSRDNCVIVSTMIKRDINDYYATGVYPQATGYVSGAIYCPAFLRPAVINIWYGNPTQDSIYSGDATYTFKIVLMKI